MGRKSISEANKQLQLETEGLTVHDPPSISIPTVYTRLSSAVKRGLVARCDGKTTPTIAECFGHTSLSNTQKYTQLATVISSTPTTSHTQRRRK
jgi:hypothetical protein